MIDVRPPTDSEVRSALAAYVAAVRARYGGQLLDIVLFGSRARGDERPGSDADVAVILENGDWRFWQRKLELAGLAYDPLLEFGVQIQPWPISRSEWENPAMHDNPRFVVNIKCDARPIEIDA